MRLSRLHTLAVSLSVGLAANLAWAELPKRDFTVEIRQVEEQGGGYSVGTTPRVPLLKSQKFLVRNGEKATVRMNVAMPMQWVQKVESYANAPTAAASAAAGQNSGAGVTNALVWMDAGHNLVVTPRWLGGKQPVQVDIDMQTASVDARSTADLPNQTRSQLVTSFNATLGEWMTVATEGEAAPSGSYSSSSAADAPRMIQIRVTGN